MTMKHTDERTQKLGQLTGKGTRLNDERNLAQRMLGQARRIDLLDAERGKYFRIVARVVADGKDVGQTLIDHNLAVRYNGEKKTK